MSAPISTTVKKDHDGVVIGTFSDTNVRNTHRADALLQLRRSRAGYKSLLIFVVRISTSDETPETVVGILNQDGCPGPIAILMIKKGNKCRKQHSHP
jgi:hypothetical protein